MDADRRGFAAPRPIAIAAHWIGDRAEGTAECPRRRGHRLASPSVAAGPSSPTKESAHALHESRPTARARGGPRRGGTRRSPKPKPPAKAKAAGGDAVELIYPSLVRVRVARTERALDRATRKIENGKPVKAATTLKVVRRQMAAAWRGAKYIIRTTPPPPPEEDLAGASAKRRSAGRADLRLAGRDGVPGAHPAARRVVRRWSR